MKGFILKEEEYKGTKFTSVYLIDKDGTEYLVGTLKKGKNKNYVNCCHKEFKKN